MSYLNIITDQNSGNIPLTVTLSGQTDIIGISDWSWDFDNGQTGDSQVEICTYDVSGIYSPVVTVNGYGASGYFSVSATGTITAFNAIRITGLVEGEAIVYASPIFYDYISGLVVSKEYISADYSFYFPPSPVPPTSSGSLKRGYAALLTNKHRYPYKIGDEKLVSKIDFIKNGRLSYISGVPVEFWANYLGVWSQVESGETDRYGSCYITHQTSNVLNCTNCLGIAKVTYDGAEYISNITRYNFYSGWIEDMIYIIDAAATGTVPDRIRHHIFDGDGRHNVFDRMFYI